MLMHEAINALRRDASARACRDAWGGKKYWDWSPYYDLCSHWQNMDGPVRYISTEDAIANDWCVITAGSIKLAATATPRCNGCKAEVYNPVSKFDVMGLHMHLCNECAEKMRVACGFEWEDALK